MKLYWVESFDHGEDWFVAAEKPMHAMQYFASEMGYDAVDDEISALLVCEIPSNFVVELDPFENEAFADEDMIAACGGEQKMFADQDIKACFSAEDLDSLGAETRVVKFDQKIFVEGNVARTVMYYKQHPAG
ncbi:MAG: hypothetical protein HRU20_29805 [Pseudomonadales bacterium]|nr:hypothetical protein [Pseudomonadales bacterium]